MHRYAMRRFYPNPERNQSNGIFFRRTAIFAGKNFLMIANPAKIAAYPAPYFDNPLIRKDMRIRVGWHAFGIKPDVA